MNLKSTTSYLKQILNWLWRGRYHSLTLLFVLITYAYLSKQLVYHPATISTMFSIVGLGIILTQQILDAREYADHKPNTIRTWLLAFPTIKPATLSVTTGSYAVIGGKAQIKVGISKDASIEAKVDFLLIQIDNLQTGVSKANDRVDELASSISKKSNELKTSMETINTSLKTTIAGHIVGAYDLNLFGITITICGTLIQVFCL